MRASPTAPLLFVALALLALAGFGREDTAPRITGAAAPMPCWPAVGPAPVTVQPEDASPPPVTRVAIASAVDSMAAVHRLLERAASATTADLGEWRELALSAADPIVVGTAVGVMGRLGALARDATVAHLLQDARLRVRQDFVVALGSTADPAAVPLLSATATSDDAAVRPLALQSLGRIGPVAAAALTELEARGGWSATEASFLRQAARSVARRAAMPPRPH